MTVTEYGRALVVLQKWNVIRLLWDCMYGLEKTAVEWRLENCDKVNKYLNISPLDWLNFEVSFHKSLQINYIIFEHQHLPECGSETKCHNRMFVILKLVRQIQNLI